MTYPRKFTQVWVITMLWHARCHCLFGSNPNNTEREPTQDDKQAAQILEIMFQKVSGNIA